MNENLAYQGRKLRRSGFIHFYFTRDGVGHIKITDHSKPHKVQHLKFSYDKFTEYDFIEELFLDASQNATLQHIQVTKVILESYSMLILNISIPDKKETLK